MSASVACRLCLALFVATPCLQAQTAATPPADAGMKVPSYDVATIKPSTSVNDNSGITTRDSTLQTQNVPLKDLLQFACHVRKQLIFGLPSWAEAARYDINAKIVDPNMAQLSKLTPEQRRGMILRLLEDRFSLKWHYETRVMSDYDLVIAKDGPRLKPATGDGKNSGTSMNNTDLTATDTPLSQLSDILSSELERPVVDKTGLGGRYDFHLKWSRVEANPSSDKGADTDVPPPVFTAIQEQLGLKLQPGKDPVQVVVVDEIKPPSED